MTALTWNLPAEPVSYRYMHHRVISSRVGKFKETEVEAHREAELLVERNGSILKLVLLNIRDSGLIAEPIQKPLDTKRYPLIEIDNYGRMTHNYYPANDRFPIIFVPQLRGLIEGQARCDTSILKKMKVGFRRVDTPGKVTTEWSRTEEDEGRKLAVLVSTFEFRSLKPRFVRPTTFSGRSEYRFDIERGLLDRGQAETELYQTIGFTRIGAKMKMGLSRT